MAKQDNERIPSKDFDTARNSSRDLGKLYMVEDTRGRRWYVRHSNHASAIAAVWRHMGGSVTIVPEERIP